MWEIYAYQNADSLFGIFNAAAAIHGSGDYMAAVSAVAFCGFIAALVAYAFAPEKLDPEHAAKMVQAKMFACSSPPGSPVTRVAARR